MGNRILLSLFVVAAFLDGCSSKSDEKVDFPYKTLKVVPSKNSSASVVLIQVGIKGGSTVGFSYQFFIKDNEKLTLEKRFLSVNNLRKYNIEWTSLNTLHISIDASRIIDFKSEVISKKVWYNITDFHFQSIK